MKRTLFACTILLALMAGTALAEEKSESAEKKMKSDDITAALQAKEMQVQEAFKNKDAAAFMNLVDANGWAADPSGFAPVSAVPDMMKKADIKSYTTEGFKALKIDGDAYVVTYTWRGEGMMNGQPIPAGPWYCSTVWSKRGKDWKAVYHQETLAMAPPPATETH